MGTGTGPFLALPAPLPERLITGDPEAFFNLHVCGQLGLGQDPDRYPPEVVAAYRRTFDDPGAVAAMCEDYRAGATVDVEHDAADRAAGRRIVCPVLVLWAAHGALPRFYGDVLDVWRPWAGDVRGAGIDARHFLAEDNPDETAYQPARLPVVMSAIARDHCLAPERVDAPIHGGRYRSLFADLPPLRTDENALHALGRPGGPCDLGVDVAADSLARRGLAVLRAVHRPRHHRRSLAAGTPRRPFPAAQLPHPKANLEGLYRTGPVGSPYLYSKDDPGEAAARTVGCATSRETRRASR